MTAVRRPRAALTGRRPWPLHRRYGGVALDMGSARTRAWVAGRGMILDVPTVTFPGAGAVYPIQRGSIVDTQGTARMLDRLLRGCRLDLVGVAGPGTHICGVVVGCQGSALSPSSALQLHAPDPARVDWKAPLPGTDQIQTTPPSHRLPRFARPVVVVTAPVLDGFAYRNEARTAVEVLRPSSVLTVPSARAVALGSGADMARPLLVMDIGAHLTEVVLLVDGAVFDARRTALGTGDLDAATPPARIGEALADMTTSMLRQDRTSLAVDALSRGPLLSGGGALRPELTCRLADRLHAPVRAVPAPHTAAVRGAAKLLESVHSHPTGTDPPDDTAH
ncbi:rod shape-determining protein [Streptomyces olivaceus]|uniref:rod shape-determining protein n=1 Tax=Streptomyces olivaceus TaxID=47716 RepID=UPI001CCE7621|nr:rod shape-determining protein [Streptomyces olivaceus]